jgi:hypothetical protein
MQCCYIDLVAGVDLFIESLGISVNSTKISKIQKIVYIKNKNSFMYSFLHTYVDINGFMYFLLFVLAGLEFELRASYLQSS